MHISCKCKCKFDGRKCTSNQKWNSDKSRCDCKNLKEYRVCGKVYFRNPTIWSSENSDYAGSVDDSVFTWDKIIDETKSSSPKTIPTKSTSTKIV